MDTQSNYTKEAATRLNSLLGKKMCHGPKELIFIFFFDCPELFSYCCFQCIIGRIILIQRYRHDHFCAIKIVFGQDIHNLFLQRTVHMLLWFIVCIVCMDVFHAC